MSFWYIFFVHFWRRNVATHAVMWGTLAIGPTLEPTRPGFQGISRINPVTGRIDRYYPWSARIVQVICSYIVLIICLGLALGEIHLLFFLRHVWHKDGHRYVFMVYLALAIEINNRLFTSIARFLTARENHQTYSE